MYKNKISDSPPPETSLPQIAVMETPDTETSDTENPVHNNTNYYKKDIEKENNNKKKTQLTNNFSIGVYLKEVLVNVYYEELKKKLEI